MGRDEWVERLKNWTDVIVRWLAEGLIFFSIAAVVLYVVYRISRAIALPQPWS